MVTSSKHFYHITLSNKYLSPTFKSFQCFPNNYYLFLKNYIAVNEITGRCFNYRENVILGEYDTRNETDCVEFEGEKQCAPPARTYKVDRYIVHPGWHEKREDDIALVRLAEQVKFNGE